MLVSKARYHYELINLIILLIQTLQLSSLTDKGNIRYLTSGNLFNLASESFWYNPSCLITSLLLSITKTFQAYLINILLRNGISRWQIWALGMLIAMRLIIFFQVFLEDRAWGSGGVEKIYMVKYLMTSYWHLIQIKYLGVLLYINLYICIFFLLH